VLKLLLISILRTRTTALVVKFLTRRDDVPRGSDRESFYDRAKSLAAHAVFCSFGKEMGVDRLNVT
jgi:hypothetical protein